MFIYLNCYCCYANFYLTKQSLNLNYHSPTHTQCQNYFSISRDALSLILFIFGAPPSDFSITISHKYIHICIYVYRYIELACTFFVRYLAELLLLLKVDVLMFFHKWRSLQFYTAEEWQRVFYSTLFHARYTLGSLPFPAKRQSLEITFSIIWVFMPAMGFDPGLYRFMDTHKAIWIWQHIYMHTYVHKNKKKIRHLYGYIYIR